MLCDNCKVNQATVHLTEIIDEEMTELHLCEDCAREKSATMDHHFGLSDLLAGLADLGAQIGTETDVKIACQNCGMTYNDFKRIGRLGCSECYQSFEKSLTGLLKRIQGSSHHIGKTPSAPLPRPHAAAKSEKAKDALQELREKLQKAVQAEAFEEAAALRDKIRELERKTKPQGK
jgi:protein arginine kinase activator